MPKPTVHDLIAHDIQKLSERIEMFLRDNETDVLVLGLMSSALKLYDVDNFPSDVGLLDDTVPRRAAVPGSKSYASVSDLIAGRPMSAAELEAAAGLHRPASPVEVAATAPAVPEAEWVEKAMPTGPIPGVEADVELIRPESPPDGQEAPGGPQAPPRRNLAVEWAGPLPSTPGTRPEPDSRPRLVGGETICPECQGPYGGEAHPTNKNGKMIGGRLPVILCNGDEVYLA